MGIARAVITYLGRISAITYRLIVGGKDIPKVAKEHHAINTNIKNALEIQKYATKAKSAKKLLDEFSRTVTSSHTAYSQYNTAKTNYESSVSTVSKYTRELAKAKRARNSSNISKYTTLLNRSKTSMSNRKRIMDRKYKTWFDLLKRAGQLAIDILSYNEEFRRAVPA